MDPATLPLMLEAAVAGGIGLFIGLEREHSDGEGAHSEDHVGVRTLAILALFGWTCAVLGDGLPWLPPAGLVVAGGLVLAHYLRVGDRDLGMTTEVAAVATFALGMLVHHRRDLAVAVGLVVTLLLVAKPWFRRTIPRLRQVELSATVQLAVVLAVVLPLLPVEARDPWGVLSPRKIGLFIVLVAGVGYVGYFLHRLLGPSRGAALGGLVGGLVSSTAVTLAMAQQSRAGAPDGPARVAALLANTVMLARVLVVAALIDRGIAAALAPPLGAMAVVLLAATARRLRAGALGAGPSDPVPLTNPFALLPALRWGVVLSLVLVVAAAARAQFGDRGLLVAAAASGLADVDAVTLAVSRQSHAGDLAHATASRAILVAVVANSLVKAATALSLGRREFGRPLAATLAAAVGLGLLVAFAR
ncbi:MAG: MgtC/SapB family protein [Myxococcales bacterium]|nr:MgtC/SapB family protein [Myxococcales bacterium]